MYESFFQLTERPFAASPNAARYFPARAIEAARQALARGIERAEGAGLLVGPSGSGKTLLLQVLAEQFRTQFAVALLSNGHLTTRRALLQAILYELGLPYRGMEEGELRLALIDRLAHGDANHLGMVLLVDEAHSLPLRLLEELRMITNLVRNGQPRVRLVLAGNSSLEERLASPKLESFSQRLRARCYLESLDRAETLAYIRAQVSAVGGSPDALFAPAAFDAVYRATDGVPRLINQVCDHAMVLSFAAGRRQLDASSIEEAWSDLQQLPTPWNESAHPDSVSAASTKDDAVIEFGSLDATAKPEHTGGLEEGAEGNEFGDAIQPTVRINQIAAQLAEFEEDFRPVGSILPEVELAFSENDDPFGEPFADEEVVVDRYATADANLGAAAKVRGPDSAAIAAMLEPFLQSESRPMLSIAKPLNEDDLPTKRGVKPIPMDTAPPVSPTGTHDWIDPADDPVMPEGDPWEISFAHSDVPIPSPSVRQSESVRFEAPAAAASGAPIAETDDDIMIVEDDPIVGTHRPVARRQEYGQLFAKLRKG
jgi:type II secretory pathway predicted ATPase ExeA